MTMRRFIRQLLEGTCEPAPTYWRTRGLPEDLAAGGDPKVGRPGMAEGSSAGWLTAQRKDFRSSRRAGFLTRRKFASHGSRLHLRSERSLHGSSRLDPHERAIARAKQKFFRN